MVKVLCICAHGDDDLPIRLPKDVDAVAVEFAVLVDRSHGYVHGFLSRFLKRLFDGPDRRPDEVIPVGEGIRAGLVIF